MQAETEENRVLSCDYPPGETVLGSVSPKDKSMGALFGETSLNS